MKSKLLFYLSLLLVLFSLSACSDSTENQQGQVRQTQKQQEERTKVIERTVVKTVKTPEKTAREQIASAAPEEQGPEESAPGDALALQYRYVNEGNYEAAYSLFAEQSQQLVSLDEYKAFFENAGYYEIITYSFSSVQVEGDTATLAIDLATSSGATGDEQIQTTQQMSLTDEGWRVVMRDGQVEALAGTTPTQTPNVQSPEDANTKQVTIEVSSDVPIDVSIADDNFDVNIAEEIVGSETYEFEIAADSGLIVDAYSETMSGNVSIAVYENGELISEDNSSEGYAQVMY